MFPSLIRGVTAGSVAVFLLASTASTEAAKKLSKADKKWVEEDVAALITTEEVGIFENLDSDKERQVFKDLFWARRDPNPMTPQNEFKEEYESRVTAADRTFKSRGARGSATDMGKIFLLLGAPQQRSRGGSGAPAAPVGSASGGAGGATPNAGAAGEDPGGAGGGEGLSALGGEEGAGGSQSATWTYAPNERLGIPQGLTVEFRARSGFGFRMVDSKELSQALDGAKSRYVLNPIINYARDDQGHLKPPPANVDPNSPAKKILQAMAETKTATPDVSFKIQNAFFRAAGSQVYIPLLFDIEGSKFTWEKDAADSTVFGLVQNADDQPVYQFEELVKLAREPDGRAVAELPLQLAPGKYMLFLGVRDNKNSAFGTQMIPLEVPDYNRSELMMSSVLLYSSGKQVTEPQGTVGHAFQFGQVHFAPKREMVYKTSETMAAFFFIYGHGVDAGKPNLTAQYIFYKDGARRGATKDEPLQANETQGVGNAEIPLAGFEPGNYKIEIRVTDHTADPNKVLKQEIEFKVVPAGS